MKEITVIGDPHQHWDAYENIMLGSENSMAVGDLGIGLRGDQRITFPVEGQHMFVRGNHDDPIACAKMGNCIDKFGVLYDGDMFCLAGATVSLCICDKESWGDKDQLTQDELEAAYELYMVTKPLVVISHEAPGLVAQDLHKGSFYPNRTSNMIGRMLYDFKPNTWIFGHHHMSYNRTYDGCQFIGLRELETHIIRL